MLHLLCKIIPFESCQLVITPCRLYKGKLVTNNTQKEEILNDQFKSVFTKDDPDSECSKNRPIGPSYPPIAHLSISTKGV